MSATEELRAAARLMRERAGVARAGIWVADGALVSADWEHEPRAVTLCDGSPVREGNLANAEHIASWHPAAALAVADLIDELLRSLSVFGEPADDDPLWSKSTVGVRMNTLTHADRLAAAKIYTDLASLALSEGATSEARTYIDSALALLDVPVAVASVRVAAGEAS